MRLLACACAFAVALPGLSQDRSDSLAVAGLRGLDVPFFQGNEVHLLPSGKEFFDDLFRQLEQAERYIHIEFYKFYNDSIGNATLDLLRRKVRQGVEVKVLIDGFGNHRPTDSFTKEDLERLRAEGILMHEFSPFAFPYIHRAYHRDHRKIITIDGHTALILTGERYHCVLYIKNRHIINRILCIHIRCHGFPVVRSLCFILIRSYRCFGRSRIRILCRTFFCLSAACYQRYKHRCHQHHYEIFFHSYLHSGTFLISSRS